MLRKRPYECWPAKLGICFTDDDELHDHPDGLGGVTLTLGKPFMGFPNYPSNDCCGFPTGCTETSSVYQAIHHLRHIRSTTIRNTRYSSLRKLSPKPSASYNFTLIAYTELPYNALGITSNSGACRPKSSPHPIRMFAARRRSPRSSSRARKNTIGTPPSDHRWKLFRTRYESRRP